MSLLTTHLTPELTVADRRQKREIRQLEQELHKWQVLVDSITGEEGQASAPFAPPQDPCWPGWVHPHLPAPGSLPSALWP